jgi:hypothetical protein
MLKFLQYIKEELLIEGANLHGKVGADGKALGHVRDYVMPLLSAEGRAKTAKALAKVGGVKGDTSVAGHMHDPKAASTHTLASKYNEHEAGTPVRVTHVSSGGEDGRNLFAHTESHGKIPLSKLAKPAALKKAPKTEGGFDVEKKLSTHLGTKAAGSSATGYDFHYKGTSTAEKPAVRGSVKMVEQKEQKKAVKGIDRPDVRGESKLMKGKFGQSVVSFEKGKGWGFRNSSKMNPMLAKATVTGPDGKERNIIDHLNKHHPKGVIDTGFTARAAKGTARHYLGSSDINTLHVHNRQVDKKTGKVTVDRGTTYTIGKTSLKGKTNLSHLGDDHIHRLDGSVNVLATKTGRAEVTHRPSQAVMRELADNAHNNPEQHKDLTNPGHAAEFKTHVDRHIAEYAKMKK